MRDAVRRVWDEANVTGAVAPPDPRPIPRYCRGCAGDCDGNCTVSISEIIDMVSIALEANPPCFEQDADRDGTIGVNEIIQAVNAALAGCSASTVIQAASRRETNAVTDDDPTAVLWRLVSPLPQPAVAATMPTLEVGSFATPAVDFGQVSFVNVALTLSGSSGVVRGIQTAVEFPEDLDWESCELRSEVAARGITVSTRFRPDHPQRPGYSQLSLVMLDLEALEPIPDGPILDCVFRVRAATACGTRALELVGTRLGDPTGGLVPVTTVNGGVTVTNCGPDQPLLPRTDCRSTTGTLKVATHTAPERRRLLWSVRARDESILGRLVDPELRALSLRLWHDVGGGLTPLFSWTIPSGAGWHTSGAGSTVMLTGSGGDLTRIMSRGRDSRILVKRRAGDVDPGGSWLPLGAAAPIVVELASEVGCWQWHLDSPPSVNDARRFKGKN